jgi:hypothetical protein
MAFAVLVQPHVDIAFDCLPLRSVGRIDVPLDASPAFRVRCERLQKSIDTYGVENAYYLYNTRCVFRLANSDVENMLRFTFEGTLSTDRGDARAAWADLAIELAAETCGAVSREVLEWFDGVVTRAVLIEFDRFIAAGKLAERVVEVGRVDEISGLAGFAGIDV